MLLACPCTGQAVVLSLLGVLAGSNEAAIYMWMLAGGVCKLGYVAAGYAGTI